MFNHETNDKSVFLKEDGFLSIKSKEAITVKDANNFWSQENKSQYEPKDTNSSISYYADIYEISEDEINIDIKFSDNTKNILSNFSVEKWGNMDLDERIAAMKELTQDVGNTLRLMNIPSLDTYEGPEYDYGFYDNSNNSICVNSMYLNDPRELVRTIAHELRHAYQYMRAEIMETKQDAIYKMNLDNYISPDFFFYDYENQYVEVDARKFSNIYAEAIK